MIQKLKDGSHRSMGRFDKAARWYPNEEITDIPGAFNVRSPSRSWPHSYMKHYYTLRFAKLLAAHKPSLYCSIQGIEQSSALYSKIMASAVTAKLKGEV